MPATIKIKNSSTASAVPTSSDLVQGELAVNVTDKRLFTENASGTVVELGTNPSILTLPAGSASAPSITANGDTNTGIFFPAADTVGITTGGTERARVDSSGNLGLGVTPSAWSSSYKALQIGARSLFTGSTGNAFYLGSNWYQDSGGTNRYIASSTAQSYGSDGDNFVWRLAASGTAGNAISFTQAMTLDASGRLGIGATSPAVKLHVSGGLRVADSTNSANYIVIGSGNESPLGNNAVVSQTGSLVIGTTAASTALQFATAGTEVARIDSSGNLLVGTTNSSQTAATGARLFSTGAIASTLSATDASDNTMRVYSTGASAYRFYVAMSGTINATSTSITAISDQSLKENIRDIDTGLSQVLALRPRRFDWKEETAIGEKDVAGFIAQEVEEVLPELVYEYQYSEGVTKKSLKMGDILPTLVKAIQEQQAIITQLQADVAALKG